MEEFDLSKFDQISKQITPQALSAMGLPSSLSPAGLVTGLIKRAVPSIGTSLLKRIAGRLAGNLTSGSGGIFRSLGKTIIRVIDAILGVIIGVIGGALLGAAGVGFAGLSGGLSGIANEPTTIHVNTRDSDNFVLHGDKAHQEKFNTFFNKKERGDRNKTPKPLNPIKPTDNKINFLQ